MSTPAPGRWAVYDDPQLRAQIARRDVRDNEEVLLALDQLHCEACVRRLRSTLGGAVQELHVDLASRTAELRHDPRAQPLSALLARLDAAGFAPRVLGQTADVDAARRAERSALTRIGVAAIGAMQVMMLAWPGYGDHDIPADIAALLRWAQWPLATAVVFYAGAPMLRGGWQALQSRIATMDLPVALSLLIAWGASTLRLFSDGDLYFDAATMFVFLLGCGRYLEGRTRARAGERLRRLAGMQLLTAQRQSADGFETVAVSALRIGDQLRVAPGEAVPADARLLDAEAALDESLLSGESLARARHAGDSLLAGSLNAGAAPLHAEVSATGDATRLAQILRLLHAASREKPRAQLLADRIAAHFIVGVLALAALGAAWWGWRGDTEAAMQVALAVLVVSCPCALSLAMPAVYAAASSRLAQDGVLLAHPAALARLRRVDTVLFDKTGTLTVAQLQLVRTETLATRSAEDCLRIAAALEAPLQHPIARAFHAAAAALPPLAPATDLRTEVGGIRGDVAEHAYWLGAPEHAPRAASLPSPAGAAGRDQSWLLLCENDTPIARFALRAPARQEAAAQIAALQASGLAVQLLTGDSAEAAQALAAPLGISSVHARQQPEDKLAHLQQLQAAGHVVMVVGDGINDAPFLAAADVAVAMPGGAPLAQARADAILVGDSLAGLTALRRVATLAQQRIVENLLWALGYNALMLPLALGNVLNPWIAALGMSISSLIVVGNALRLGRSRAMRLDGSLAC